MKLLDKEKSPRVSFATSPDKTMDSTPPPSPSHTDLRTDDDFVKSSSSNNNKASKKQQPLLVNKILCRVPSHESNISDLSASLSPSYKRNEQSTNITKESGNPIVALLNVCGVEEISDLMTNSLAGGPSASTKEVKSRRRDKPAVWGMAPSLEEEDEDTLSPQTSSGSTSNNTSVEYDNVELVLDESAFAPPPPPPSGRRSPFSGNGILKNKLSGMVNKSTGRTSSTSAKEEMAPSVIISPEVKSSTSHERSSPTEDGRISHTYDVASFQNELLRPTPVDLAVGDDHYMAASAAAAEVLAADNGSRANGGGVRSSPVDSISGEVNMKPVVVKKDESKKMKGKKGSSKSSKASAVSKTLVVNDGSKASLVAEMPGKDGKKASSAEPSRKFLKMPSFKKKNAKDKDDVDVVVAATAKENVENKTITDTSTSKKKQSKKKKSDPVEATPPITPTNETILDAKYWKATLDPNTSQTYYYHTETKVTTWEKPEGFDEAQKLKEDAKLWKATVDPNSGKTYYYHGKTKEVRWTKPEGFVERKKKKKREEGKDAGVKEEKKEEKASEVEADSKEVAEVKEEKEPTTSVEKTEVEKEALDTSPPTAEREVKDDPAEEQVSNEPIVDAIESSKEEDAPADQPQTVKRVQSIEDAPFDEPIPARQPRQPSPQDTTDDDTFGSLPSITNDVEPNMKPIDFNTRSKTFMSQMTDKTPRFNNTTATMRTKDFTNTQIDVNVTTDTRGDGDDGHPSSLDSSLASAENSAMPTGKGVDPPGAGSKNAGARHVATLNNDNFDDEESAVFDDWSDEVSELSGIGNDERAVMKKLLMGRNAKRSNKSSRDTRADKSSSRNRVSNQPSRNERPKEYSQQELDSFIAKDDWVSVSKYISEMRNNKNKVKRNQPTPHEIQEAIKYNRRMESNENGPKKRFGAKSQMQHDNMDSSSYFDGSPAESDSVSYNSGDSSFEGSSYDESPRGSPLPRHTSRKQVT